MTAGPFVLALLLAAPQAAPAPGGFDGEVRVGAPITAENLTVFPLLLRHAAVAEEHLTLDEALRSRQLSIAEAGKGGAVNELEVENRGARPVVLVAGELLLGGKQDRIVGRSLVLAARSRARVPVFCVEHGRWSSGAAGFESARAMGHVELRKMALSGDQGKVWSEVARSNARLGTTSASDTYRAAARRLGGDTASLVRRVLAGLDATPEAAGLAVAVGGEVVAAEWFGSPRIFGQLREKLVASYAAQALASGRPAPAAPPASKDVADFAAKAEQGEGVIRERVPGAAGASPIQSTYLKR